MVCCVTILYVKTTAYGVEIHSLGNNLVLQPARSDVKVKSVQSVLIEVLFE